MERKRKLPARAAARVEQAAKRRTSTPPTDSVTTRSATPALSTVDTEDDAKSQPEAPQRHPLPRHIQPGKPLPTVERPQPEDLSGLEYQSVQESGVLSESLSRSRQKWLNEGIFEKYWTKPSKRKGVANDDPKNPPKDSMIKLGQVRIIVEPHMFEVTMYGVKDPKPATALPANRPVIMYGPSRGMMPPPSAPGTPTMPKQPKKKRLSSKSPAPTPPNLPGTPAQNMAMPATTPIPLPQIPQATPIPPQQAQLAPPLPPPQPPTPAAAAAEAAKGSPCPPTPTPSSKPVLQPPNVSHHTPPPALSQLQTGLQRQQSLPQAAVGLAPKPIAPANGLGSNPPANKVPPSPSMARPPAIQPSPVPAGAQLQRPSPAMSPAPGGLVRQPSLPPNAARPPTAVSSVPSPSPGPAVTPRPPLAAAAAPAPGSDSIIVTLAERASSDPKLRDLMKRVANKQAPKDELDKFQAIINQITAEKQQRTILETAEMHMHRVNSAPSADRLVVDGRTVRYFAEEVRAILDIVLRSNPRQTSADLRPPVGSDPLVVLLVKAALDDVRVRDIVRRIGENVALYTDATDLEGLLIRLKNQLTREQEAFEQQQRLQLQAAQNAGVPLAPAGGVPMMSGAQPNAGPQARAPPQLAPGTPQGGHAVPAKANGAANANANANATANANTNGTPNARGQASTGTPPQKGAAAAQHHHASKDTTQQALRTRAPAAAKMHDVSALVFEFAGGTGDRYLYPKYSVIQYVPTAGGGEGPPDVVSSFLIVRKGSASEYGGDPDLDYYQPITVRFQVSPQSHSQRILEYFARVVAPADEVARYMDNIMNSMTRAEYVLLAMRLPRKTVAAAGTNSSSDAKNDDDSSSGDKTDAADNKKATGDAASSNSSSSNGHEGSSSSYTVGHPQPLHGVLWATSAVSSSSASASASSGAASPSGAAARPKTASALLTGLPGGVATAQQHAVKQMVDEDQQYQEFIAGLIPKEVDEA